MALSVTMHQFELSVSDVDRGVYETFELRIARHPSESLRYMLTRVLAYALSYEEGISFSKGGLSQTDAPPISITDPTGVLKAWIDIGSPSADRLHKASKASERVALFTSADIALLRREAATRAIHKVERIEAWRIAPSLLEKLETKVERKMKMEILRTEGQLYVTIDGSTFEGLIERVSFEK